ncbi:hypothetical protein APS56_05345 [Pseudalgibacter alginicilyticus]|uniref:Glycosyltransferase 2-like domain-containing protein n=2 Tax=Pseudalgibacter alginicilyticus TaxID=1736674 RepID=A0A0N7HY91_9FLAO|nr:hypothetical protein APS56_05345 [Pseudalgibacter alginicilyticus]
MQQTYTNWEVVIVDDCSTDNSLQVIKNIIKKDSRFKLYQNTQNKGCGFTKGKCVQLAQGTILGFLDPDDALTSNALQVMIKAHFSNKEAAIITSKYELVDLNMNFKKASLYGSHIPMGKSYLTYANGALTHFASFKKEKYQKSEGINPLMKRAVDQDLYYKLEEEGKHVFIDKTLYRYRIHENSISCNDNLYKAEYWHFYAINKAYKRRRKLKLSIDNFSRKYMSLYNSNYYLKRFVILKFSKKNKSKFYFLGKSFLANPRHEFVLKFKSLLLLIVGRI